jgi:predicted secreted protein
VKYTTILLMIWAFTCSNCNTVKPAKIIVVSFSEEKQKTTITVHRGDTLLIKLRMASGTGYVWEVLPANTSLCKQGDTKYEYIKKRMPGAPLMEVISFSIIAKGEEDISFIFHRPFEKNTAPAKIKTLHLIVQ